MINCLFILTFYILPASQILNQFQQVLILLFYDIQFLGTPPSHKRKPKPNLPETPHQIV